MSASNELAGIAESAGARAAKSRSRQDGGTTARRRENKVARGRRSGEVVGDDLEVRLYAAFFRSRAR